MSTFNLIDDNEVHQGRPWQIVVRVVGNETAATLRGEIRDRFSGQMLAVLICSAGTFDATANKTAFTVSLTALQTSGLPASTEGDLTTLWVYELEILRNGEASRLFGGDVFVRAAGQDPRSPVYLPLERAELLLTRAALYSEETMPSSEDLTELLLAIEDRVDEALERRVAPTRYEENITTNRRGIAMMNHYPVISVEDIAVYNEHIVGTDPVPVRTQDIPGIWRQDRRLYLEFPLIVVRVRYTAGLRPIPRVFEQVTFEILSRSIAQKPWGSLAFLDAIYQEREISSISLPGGLSKSFKTYRPTVAMAPGSGAGGALTELDRLMAPLKRYRYNVVTA